MRNKIAVLRLISLLLLTVLVSGCGINNIPSYEEAANASWSQVENQYKRRADLIPNLVETVKGFAAQEKEVLTEVVEARSKATSINLGADALSNPALIKQFQASQDALSGALSRLLVSVERYPDLKSDQNFLTLQSQLEGTENRVSVARRDFIDAVRKYNTELKTFPGRIWKSILYPGSEPKANFEAPVGSEAVPEVKFN